MIVWQQLEMLVGVSSLDRWLTERLAENTNKN